MISKFFTRKSKDMNGVVKKISSDKTVCVTYNYDFTLPKYGKVVGRKSTFLVHDEDNNCKVGDKVIFYVTRPISRRKYMVIKSVVQNVNNLNTEDGKEAVQ